MALDQSGLLEVLDALKAADVVTGPPGRRNVYQALVEAELTDTIGAALHERTESRINLRNGHRTRILSTTAGDRAPCSSASAARSRSAPDERRQPCRRPGSLRILWRGCRIRGAGGGSKVRVSAQHRLLQRAQRGRRWRWGCRCATTSW